MRVVFMGSGEIGLPTLRYLINNPEISLRGVVTQPDKKVGRKQIITPSTIKITSQQAGIPVRQPVRMRHPDAVAAFAEWRPDITVVMAYGQILPRAVLDVPALACVNLHASLLPRHRGASPIQAAIREGDSESGITLMHVVEKLDAGDMILSRSLGLAPDETGGSLHDKLAALGPDVMKEGFEILRNNPERRIPQDESVATYAGKLERSDGVVDWSCCAEYLARLIRAYDPWPGTSTSMEVRGRIRQLKLFPPADALPCTEQDEPGTVVSDGGDFLEVATGSGRLRVGSLQWEGKKRLSASQFVRGGGCQKGTLLGVKESA